MRQYVTLRIVRSGWVNRASYPDTTQGRKAMRADRCGLKRGQQPSRWSALDSLGPATPRKEAPHDVPGR